MIPKGTVKPTVIVEEQPKVSIVVSEFLVIDYLSVVNKIIGRLLLKALKAVTSIYHLTMKFLNVEGMGQVQGSQYDLRECYNKSLKLVEKERKFPQKMEVGKIIMRPSENPCS